MALRPSRLALALACLGALALGAAQSDRVTLNWLGTAATGVFGESAAEIVVHDPGSQRLFVVNALSGQIDVVDIADPAAPSFLDTIQVGSDGEVANSVAVHDGLVAVAVQAAVKTDAGRVAFFTVDGAPLASVGVGALPDMLTVTPDGHRVAGAGFDASDRDGAIAIRPWPVYGMYMPDGIALLEWQGATYVLTANEGDARDYDALSEEARVKDLELVPSAFPNADVLQADVHLGRLTVTTTLGDADGDGRYEALYAFGARSFSVWTANGDLLFDSGDQFEQVVAARYPAYFNANHEDNSPGTFDNRSDNEGPEPEGVTIGVVDGVPFAFIVLERIGGVMIYDLSDPTAPTFAGYTNHRTFGVDAESADALDLGAESSIFVTAADSPTGAPLLVVANEISGTTSIFEVVVRR